MLYWAISSCICTFPTIYEILTCHITSVYIFIYYICLTYSLNMRPIVNYVMVTIESKKQKFSHLWNPYAFGGFKLRIYSALGGFLTPHLLSKTNISPAGTKLGTLKNNLFCCCLCVPRVFYFSWEFCWLVSCLWMLSNLIFSSFNRTCIFCCCNAALLDIINKPVK